MMPWTSEEHLATEELLEEASATFASHFKPETWFERTINISWQNAMNCTLCNLASKQIPQSHPLSARRSLASLSAEAYLAKHLSWKVQMTPGYLQHDIQNVLQICKKMVSILDEKVWLETHPIPGADIDMLKPYLAGITVPLESVSKGVRKRYYVSHPLHHYIALLDDASHLRKGVTIMLGMGETLDDIPELHHFIQTNKVDKVTFLPLIPHKNTPFKKSPSSFYVTRWIAETRIAFPTVEISAGTWKGRVAEVGLFLKAGANAITKFPAVRRFNSEDAQSIEQEIATAKRQFTSTLTDVGKLYQLKDLIADQETKDKLMQYIQTIQEHK